MKTVSLVAQRDTTRPNTPARQATPFENWLIRQRVFCESDGCMKRAQVCRQVDGSHRVFCFLHDPQNGLREFYDETLPPMGVEHQETGKP